MALRCPKCRGVSLGMRNQLASLLEDNIRSSHQEIIVERKCNHRQTLHGTRGHDHAFSLEGAAGKRSCKILRGMDPVRKTLHLSGRQRSFQLHCDSSARSENEMCLNALNFFENLQEPYPVDHSARATDSYYDPLQGIPFRALFVTAFASSFGRKSTSPMPPIVREKLLATDAFSGVRHPKTQSCFLEIRCCFIAARNSWITARIALAKSWEAKDKAEGNRL